MKVKLQGNVLPRLVLPNTICHRHYCTVINDYDVEQNYEKNCLASVPQQYLIHKQHKHLDISDQPKSNAILNAILLYAMQY